MAVVSASLLSSSCTYETFEEVVPAPLPTVVSFKNDIQPIFNKSCVDAGCHSGDVDPDLTPAKSYNALTNYVKPGDAAGSSLYQVLASGAMPESLPKLPQDQINLVEKWINDGALNN